MLDWNLGEIFMMGRRADELYTCAKQRLYRANDSISEFEGIKSTRASQRAKDRTKHLRGAETTPGLCFGI
jgi:hypothetical protein